MREFPIALPAKMRALPEDHRGFPVPYFVTWFKDGKPCRTGEGEPNFLVVDPSKMATCVKERRCWVCGDRLGVHMAFVIGPMCAINRTISEPPSHLECAMFSARCCPFLSQPRMRRNEKALPDEYVKAPGEGILRNPGAACVWVTRGYKVFKVARGVLFELGEPEAVTWWARGREATRDEVLESIRTGFPLLKESAEREGPAAVAELERYFWRAAPLVPA